MEIVLSYSILVEPEEEVEMIKEDPDDNKFLECSLKAYSDYMISGDQHLLDFHLSILEEIFERFR